jgi:hypothetical protein
LKPVRFWKTRLPALVGVAVVCAAAPGIPAGAAPAAGPANTVPPIPALLAADTFNGGPKYLVNAGDNVHYSPLAEPDFIVGHDNGQSALYQRGRTRFSFWAFGDTGLTSPNGDGDDFVGNTGARTTDLTFADNVTQWTYHGDAQGPKPFLTLRPDEVAFNEEHVDTDPNTAGCQPKPGVPQNMCGDEYAIWGGAMVADPGNQRMLAVYGLIMRFHLPDGNMWFKGVGTGLAEWTETVSDGDGWRRLEIANATDPARPTALWPYDPDYLKTSIDFDKAPVVRDGMLYLYGCYDDDNPWHRDCRLTRVSLRDRRAVSDRSAYEFYAGVATNGSSLWTRDLGQAQFVPQDNAEGTFVSGPAGSTVFWVAALGVYMTVRGLPLSNDVEYAVAYRPEGPWSQARHLTTTMRAHGDGLGGVGYAHFVHPEYAEQGGLVQYMTYTHLTSNTASDMPIVKIRFAPPAGR